MNYRCSNMENEISSDDVNSCLTQEYYKLLAKVEELLRKNPARSDDFTIDTISLRADGHFGKYKFINIKFEHLGDVHGLGFSDPHPLLILVDTQQQLDKAPPLYIDDYNRTFKLQFLLMTRQSFLTHLIAGLNMFDRWVLYDDLKLSPCDDFNLKCADFTEDFVILFAGYVNITHDDQDRDVPFGVAEEGYQGTVPFNPSRGCNDYGKEHID
ncbi:hypothetical protein ROHU_022308 [Labeo rohita]|uniref:Uncharacterized protein n=1 Tax=Labeo rohita TaxID=84645 RepID=A0A498N5W6_LABRO|nr:hypothetical protein ROHU_022308 [Labeo rohita]